MTHTVHLPLILNHPPRLKDLFGKHGIQFGFCVHDSSFENPIKRQLIVQHANIVTTGSLLNMKFVQPEQGVFYWDRVDQICESAHELGIDVHGIPGSWAYPLNPDWLVNGAWTNEQLANILKDHVGTLAAHYEEKFVSLNVANEAWIWGGLYGGVWTPLGDDYVYISFQSAQDNSTYPILYNSFYPAPYHEKEYDKMFSLLDSGLADGVGIQLHLWQGDWDKVLARADSLLSRIRARGDWCSLSEIGVIAASDKDQAIIYAAITRLAIKYADIIKRFIIWGITNPCWRGRSVIFDHDGQPMPSYHAIVEELRKC